MFFVKVQDLYNVSTEKIINKMIDEIFNEEIGSELRRRNNLLFRGVDFAWQKFANCGQRLEAIKLYRDCYGVSLATAAKEVRDYIKRNNPN